MGSGIRFLSSIYIRQFCIGFPTLITGSSLRQHIDTPTVVSDGPYWFITLALEYFTILLYRLTGNASPPQSINSNRPNAFLNALFLKYACILDGVAETKPTA
ncbi:hypothetical protein SDC9_79717 [bioreactor metagenome]|uniref:Uncharacterized protein n=1 Tax=bioreactor metagenome TaxID=1076179 RepID=A0A644YYN3_9ZZZZ